MMRSMGDSEEYEWVDDPALTFDEVLERIEDLEPVQPIVPPIQMVIAPVSSMTTGGAEVKTLVKSFTPATSKLVQRVS